MKRFTTCTKALAFCTFLLTSTPVAHACGWDATDNYYLFYAFEGDRTAPGHAAQHLSAWWTKYVGRDVTTEQLSELAEIDPSQLRRSNNPLVRAATKKNDQTMLSYLRLLCEYLHVEPQGEEALWDYPDEAEKAEVLEHNLLEIRRLQNCKVSVWHHKSTCYAYVRCLRPNAGKTW